MEISLDLEVIAGQKMPLHQDRLCMYAAQWKKPTGLLVWSCSPSSCARTGKPSSPAHGHEQDQVLDPASAVLQPGFCKSLDASSVLTQLVPSSHTGDGSGTSTAKGFLFRWWLARTAGASNSEWTGFGLARKKGQAVFSSCV